MCSVLLFIRQKEGDYFKNKTPSFHIIDINYFTCYIILQQLSVLAMYKLFHLHWYI